jgi:hypothetical protein
LIGRLGLLPIFLKKTAIFRMFNGPICLFLSAGSSGNGAINTFLMRTSKALIMLLLPFFSTFLSGTKQLRKLATLLYLVSVSLVGKTLVLALLNSMLMVLGLWMEGLVVGVLLEIVLVIGAMVL